MWDDLKAGSEIVIYKCLARKRVFDYINFYKHVKVKCSTDFRQESWNQRERGRMPQFGRPQPRRTFRFHRRNQRRRSRKETLQFVWVRLFQDETYRQEVQSSWKARSQKKAQLPEKSRTSAEKNRRVIKINSQFEKKWAVLSPMQVQLAWILRQVDTLAHHTWRVLRSERCGWYLRTNSFQRISRILKN